MFRPDYLLCSKTLTVLFCAINQICGGCRIGYCGSASLVRAMKKAQPIGRALFLFYFYFSSFG
jgi:hypothetical protein